MKPITPDFVPILTTFCATISTFKIKPHKESFVAFGITASFLMWGYFVSPTFGLTDTIAGLSMVCFLFFLLAWIKQSSGKDKSQRDQLTALFENATEGIIFTNSIGEIIRINESAGKMFGFMPNELVGSKVERLIPDRHLKVHEDLRQRFNQSPHNRPMGLGKVLYARHKNNFEFPVEVSISHFYINDELYIVSFIVDITERKKISDELVRLKDELEVRVDERTFELVESLVKLENINRELCKEIENRKSAELELTRSQRLYTAMAHNFPNGIMGVLNKEKKYMVADGSGLHELGLTGEEISKELLFDDIHPILSKQAEKFVQRTFAGEKTLFDAKIDDQVYQVVCTPLPDAMNEINEILVVITNITERKKIEDDLVRALAKEKQLNALQSNFVTMASHQFRTPLSTILSSAFLIDNYTGTDAEVKRKVHVEKVKRSVHTLTELLDDFLSLGKIDEGKIKVVAAEIDCRKLVDEVLQDIDPVKKAGQEIVVTCDGTETMIKTDGKLVRNILMSLLSNAIKYSTVNSKILLAISYLQNTIRFQVSDTGIGIPAGEQRNIFKRFYRAQNVINTEGTGLGLNIARKYVKLLRGTIGFTSRPNEGTTFTVSIPGMKE